MNKCERSLDGNSLIVTEDVGGTYEATYEYPFSGGCWLMHDGVRVKQVVGTCDIRAPRNPRQWAAFAKKHSG